MSTEVESELEAKLSRLRSSITHVEQHDAMIRERVIDLSQQLAEECRRGCVAYHTNDFTLEEIAENESTYGYVGVSQEGIYLAYRSTMEDIQDSFNNIPQEFWGYRVSKPDAWPVHWLRLIVTEERLAALIDGLNERAAAIAKGHAVLADRVGRLSRTPSAVIEEQLRSVSLEFGFTKIISEWAEAQRALYQSPASAVRAACVLVETTLKHLYKNRGVELPNNKDVHSLYATLTRHTRLIPDSDANEDIIGMLRGLNNVVQHVGALRTKIGDAHGKSPGQSSGGIEEARLAVDSAGALSVYLIRKLTMKKGT